MRITLLTYGSRGDVQPFIALGTGLLSAGHQVRLAAPSRHESLARERGISFAPLAGDPAVLSRQLNDAGRNPLRMIRAMQSFVLPIAARVASEAREACSDADLIIHSFLFTSGGHALARERRVPDISALTFPAFAPTSAFAPVAFPALPLGSGYNRLAHALSDAAFWYGGKIGYARLRRNGPGLPPRLFWPFEESAGRARTPLLFAWSPVVLAPPDEWAGRARVTGYWFLDSPADYRPPPELAAFLEAGSPPVCISFGSMVNRDAEKIGRTVEETLAAMGLRAIVLAGWGSYKRRESTRDILVLDAAPHDWLLPRCAAVIHHGGAGTTGAGLRAGVPNVVVPFAADQPFWAARVDALGAGPKPIPVGQLTAERLERALNETLGNEALRRRSARIGERIRAEQGVTNAIQFIETHAHTFR